ncbi:hypothetical protein FRB95_006337 [Tulasnella sp. JGI-2019a]|nr:hypothetical protein FRB95_006337 [Tulasnella sp. JGI-2019a]
MDSKQMAYQGFNLTDDQETIVYENQAEQLSVYGGVVSSASSAETQGHFVYLGKGLGDLFVELRMLKKGLHRDHWENIYDAYEPTVEICAVWLKDGTLAEGRQIPNAMFTAPDQHPPLRIPDLGGDWKVSEHHDLLKRTSEVRRRPLERGIRAKTNHEEQEKRRHLGDEWLQQGDLFDHGHSGGEEADSGRRNEVDRRPSGPGASVSVSLIETGQTDNSQARQLWVDSQLKRWNDVVRSVLDARVSAVNSVGRPVVSQDTVSLVFTLDQGNDGTIGNGCPISLVDLESAVKRAFQTSSVLARVTCMTWEQAAARGSSLILISSHFLQLYHTWMSPSDFSGLVKSRDQNMTALERPWPDRVTALKVQQDCTTMDPKNSLITIAKAFWPDYPVGIQSADWLNYSALRLGGASGTIDLIPPPTNLAFATNETNAQAMRAKKTIASILKMDQDWRNRTKQTAPSILAISPGRLTMRVMPSGYAIKRMGLDGKRITKTIPQWQTELQDPSSRRWLSLALQSTWTMEFSAWNAALHGSQLLDSFSRRMPLREEMDLDDALIEVIREKLTPSSIAFEGKSISQAQTIGPEVSLLLPPPPYDGFVVKGDTFLFGINSLSVQVESWPGSSLPDVILGEQPVLVQRVKIKREIRLSTILPALTGSTFDSIRLENSTILHQNYVFDRTKSTGWHLDADWVIDITSGGDIYSILSNTLGITAPFLHVHAGLGLDQNWERPLGIHSITLAGVFPNISYQPLASDWIRLASIGVRFYGVRGMEYELEPRSVLRFDFAVFGGMELKIQRSPLTLDYELGVIGDMIHIVANLREDRWKDPLGIQGLTLSEAVFATSFKRTSPWKDLAFETSAVYNYGDTRANFSGYHKSDGSFSLTAPLQNFDMRRVNDLFKNLLGDTVSLPSIDIHIESASATISNKGFIVNLQNVRIAEHAAPDASLTMSPTGLLLKGKLSSDIINYMGVQVREPRFNVAIEKTGSTKSTDVAITGRVKFGQLDFDVAVHLYPSENANGGIAYTVLAAVEPQGKPALEIADIVPAVRGTSMNLPLGQVTFVVASQDKPSLGGMISSGYTFKQGVQLCATLSDTFESLDTLTKTKTPGLVLNVKWSPIAGYTLEVRHPTPTTLDFGNGIRTTPVTLEINPVKMNLVLTSGLIVPITPDPLEFSLSLGISAIDVFGTGSMRGWWRNPMGISKAIAIGEDLTLAIGGTPATGLSKLEFGGALAIGKVQAQFEFKWGVDARNDMLRGELQYLSLVDLADFASNVVGTPIPRPPEDYLSFSMLKLYICPANSTAGKAGFSFSAIMSLFGKAADIECSLGVEGIILKGGVNNFKLGPYLTITGANGEPRAVVDCAIGRTNQRIFIDGMVTFFEAGTAIHVEVDALPTPKFDFQLELKFSELLIFKLSAKIAGAVSFKELKDVDFIFDAEMEQKILAHINSLLGDVFKNAYQVLDNNTEKHPSNPPDRAAAIAEHARVEQAWLDRQASILLEFNTISEKCATETKAREAEVKLARSGRDDVESRGRASMELAANENAAQILLLQHAVDNAKRELEQNTNDAEKILQKATVGYNRSFGTIQTSLDTAKRQLLDYENSIQKAMSLMQDTGQSATRGFWKTSEVTAAKTSIDAQAAAKRAAEDNVKKSKAALKSSESTEMQKRISDARENLATVQKVGDANVKDAKAVLESKRAQAADELQAEKHAYAAAKTAADLKVEAAKKSLEETRLTNQRLLKAAEKDRAKKLEGCPEHLAYKESKAHLAAVQLKDKRDRDSVQVIGEVFRGAGRAYLELAEQITQIGTGALDIQSIHLSGSLRGLVGVDGRLSKPLTAQVAGTLLGVSFAKSLQYKPGKDLEFIHALSNFILAKTKAINDLVKDAKKNIDVAVKEVNQQAAETREQLARFGRSSSAKTIQEGSKPLKPNPEKQVPEKTSVDNGLKLKDETI